MRKQYFFIVLLSLFCSAFSLSLSAEDLLMPQFGSKEMLVQNDAPITFYDMKGEEDIKGTSTYNSFATMIFKPADQSRVVAVSFEMVELKHYGTSGGYPAYMKVYDGVFDVTSVVYPDKTSGVTMYLSFPKTSAQLDSLNGSYTNLQFISTDPSGALSFCYHFLNATNCKGWKATVSAIEKKDLAITAATADYSKVDNSIFQSKQDVALGAVKFSTEGFSNPDVITSLSFTLTNANVFDATSFKLYSGSAASTSGLTEITSTLSENNGTYTLSLNKPLTMGDNFITVGANVRADAAFDATASMNITAVATQKYSTGYSAFTPATPAVMTVARLLNMSSGVKSYDVSGQLSLYDDGGAEGKISNNFEGTLTLSPTTVGKKVMINFKELDIFYTTSAVSVGNQDLLKVYSGATKDEANLLYSLEAEKAKNVLLRSDATDGKLTIYLRSKTSSASLQGDGFEAIVSEFVPQPMTLNFVAEDQDTTLNIVSGMQDAVALSFNLNTTNTEPALNLQSLNINTKGSWQNIESAKLYYTKNDSSFTTKTLVGEAVVGADIFTLTATAPLDLREGNNRFWLVYTLKNSLVNGATIDAAIDNVVLSGTTTTDVCRSDASQGVLTIDNVAYADCGTATYNIYGDWKFTHTPTSATNSNCKPQSCDQIVVFKPITADRVIQLDFSKFDLEYSTSYGTKAQFIIYDGEGTTGNVLWELDATNLQMGPRIVRANAANGGVLTVKYNGKTTSSSSTGEGWIARVSEYQSRDMEVMSVEVTHPTTDILKVGALNQSLLRVGVRCEGDLTPLSLMGFTLNMKNSSSNIDSVFVYSTADSDEADYTTSLGRVKTTNLNDLFVEIEPTTLNEGMNYFWVNIDVAKTATPNAQIDAALVNMLFPTGMHSVTSGDPEGERIVKNVLDLQSGDNGVVNIGEHSLMFYDVGGATESYPRSFKGHVTFMPTEPNTSIELVLKKWDISSGDNFKIYYKDKVDGKEDMKLKNDAPLSSYIVSSAPNGVLTVDFACPSYYKSGDGWEIEVKLHHLTDLVVDSVVSSVVAPSQVMKGETDVAMTKFAVHVTGDLSSVELSKLTFSTTTAANIDSLRVYYTGQLDNFATTDMVGACGGASNEIVLNHTIANRGVYYFWVVSDIKTTATTASNVQIQLNTVEAAGVAIAPKGTTTATATIKEGKSGTFTIGNSEAADYKTINAAFSYIKDGISGPVVFNIESGVYSEQADLPEVKGASRNNTITLKSASGNYSDVKIENNGKNDGASNGEGKGVITISGTDYLTISGIEFSTTKVNAESVIYIKNMSRHLTIDNCYIHAPISVDFSGTKLIYQYAKNEANKNNDYFTLSNSTIEGGRIGMYLNGTGHVVLPKQVGGAILNNHFINQGAMSLYVIRERMLSVVGNTFENDETTKIGFSSMDITAYEGTKIVGNSVILNTDFYAYGIYLRNIQATTASPAYIYNNEIIVNTKSAGTWVGIGIGLANTSDFSSNVNIAHNSVLMRGTSVESLPFSLNKNFENINVENNIFQNESGAPAIRYIKESAALNIVYRNNSLYANGTAFAKIGSEELAYADWVTRVGAVACVNSQVPFTGASLMPTALGDLQSSLKLNYVQTDIVGKSRGEQPTMGAYEFENAVVLPPLMSDGYPRVENIKSNSADVVVKSDEVGSVYLLAVAVGADAPDSLSVINNSVLASLRAGTEAVAMIDNLQPATQYDIYYIMSSVGGENSKVVKAATLFTTLELPLAISDFENITSSAEGFVSGTQLFKGFAQQNIASEFNEGTYAAQATDNASLEMTNTALGCEVEGFYYRSAADVNITISGVDNSNAATSQNAIMSTTNGSWVYYNLRSYGKIKSIAFASTSANLYIDDFAATAQKIELSPLQAEYNVSEDDQVSLSAQLAHSYSGVAPYSYVWKNRAEEQLSTEATYQFQAAESVELMVIITDAWMQVDTVRTMVNVSSPQALMAGFEEQQLTAESNWNGDASWTDNTTNSWLSGSYKFNTYVWRAYSYWTGFAISNETSTEYTDLTHQFRSATGSAYEGNNYGVYYNGNNQVKLNHAPEGAKVSGFYITNSAWTVDAILNGDNLTPGAFGEGDYFKLIIKGMLAGEEVSTKDYYLADYRAANALDRYYLDTWQWVDLDALGSIDAVKFSFESSRKNDYGVTTPNYFCLDNFGGERVTTDLAQITVSEGSSIHDMAQYFTLDNDGSTVKYSIVSETHNGTISSAISGAQLTITATGAAEQSVVVCAVQKGKQQFVRLPISTTSVGTATDDVAEVSATIYPNPVAEQLYIRTAMEDYSIMLYSTSGELVYVSDSNVGNSSISLSEMPNGIYIIKISNEQRVTTHRVVVKH